VRPIRVTTETAIPTVFQVELAEVAEEGAAEEVDKGETVDLQEVMLDTVGPIDDEIVRVPGGVVRTAADLDEVGVRVIVDEETVDNTEESVVVGPSGGDRTPSRLGRRPLVIVTATRENEGTGVAELVVVGRILDVLVAPPSMSPKPSRKSPCRFLPGAPVAYRETTAPDV
jgi:hypothetical protein